MSLEVSPLDPLRIPLALFERAVPAACMPAATCVPAWPVSSGTASSSLDSLDGLRRSSG